MSAEIQNNEFPMHHVTFYDLRALSEYAMEIDRLLRTFSLESHRLLRESGGVHAQGEAALCVLEGNELRHAIWMLIGALIERRATEGPLESQKTDDLFHTALEEDKRWHELSDVPQTSSP